MIVTGAMTNINWSLTAGQETHCPFSFNLLVKDVQRYGDIWGTSTEIPSLNTFHDDKLTTGVLAGSDVRGSISRSVFSPRGKQLKKAPEYTNTYYFGSCFHFVWNTLCLWVRAECSCFKHSCGDWVFCFIFGDTKIAR